MEAASEEAASLTAASEEAASEEAASEEAAAEDAVEDAAVEAAPPQAVMPTASARAAAAIATVLTFIGISPFFLCWCQASGSIPTALVGLMFSYYTHIDKKSKLFSSKINDETRTVTILT